MHSTPGTDFAELSGALPADCVSEGLDLGRFPDLAKEALESFDSAHFTEDLLWRDHLCMTGSIHTYSGKERVMKIWTGLAKDKQPSNFDTKPASVARFAPDSSCIAVPFTFETQQNGGLVGLCSGSASFVSDGTGAWKIWMLTTVLEQFQDLGNPDHYPVQEQSGQATGGTNGHAQVNGNTGQEIFDAIIVGAGQAGLCLAGRFAALGLSYVLIERSNGVGTSWTNKYDSVKQHTIRQFNYLPFDPTWTKDDEVLLPAKKVTEGYQRWAQKYNINVWLSSNLETCVQDATTGEWTVGVMQEGGRRTAKAKHLALTMGAGVSTPNSPNIPNQAAYTGETLHQTSFRNAKAWRGKSATIIGTGTTAHDIAEDMLKHGVSPVTMIQRTKTAVFPVEWHVQDLTPLYNDHMPTELSDRLTLTAPMKITRDIIKDGMQRQSKIESERFAALERAGFKVDWDAHLHDKIYKSYGGYYIDVGASKEIADGNIKVKSGVPIKQFTESGLAFKDGTELKSDIVVLATGYEAEYRKQAANVIGMELASSLGDFWGLDEEGEVRGIMKPMAPGLWFMGGPVPNARWWSRFYALQIQADVLGKPLQPVAKQTNGVHH